MRKIFSIVLILGMLVCAGTTIVGCNSGGGEDEDDNYNTSGIEQCETNGNCGGCCSWHGGVGCRNGVTVCNDGSPLSDICRDKGCSACINCPSGDSSYCDGFITDFGDPSYYQADIQVEWEAFDANGICTDINGNTVKIETRPAKTVIESYTIYKIHLDHEGDTCYFPDHLREELALYIEIVCNECDEISPMAVCVNWSNDTLREPLRPFIQMLLRGEMHELTRIPWSKDDSGSYSSFDEEVCDEAEASGGTDYCEYTNILFRGFFFFEPYSRENCVPTPCTPQPYTYDEIEAIFINGHRIEMFELK